MASEDRYRRWRSPLIPPDGVIVVTSPYGERVHPTTGEVSMHTGVDLRAEEGQPVYAAADGRVVGFFDDDINGYGILIHHPSSTGQPSARTAYIHLRDRPTHKMHDLVWAPATWRVPWGVSRPPCLPIGYAGSTGRSTGPHLHMEIRILDISWHRADPLTVIDFSPYTIEYK